MPLMLSTIDLLVCFSFRYKRHQRTFKIGQVFVLILPLRMQLCLLVPLSLTHFPEASSPITVAISKHHDQRN